MPDVMLTCKSCHKEFHSGMNLPKDLFKKATLVNNPHRCPNCGKMETYNKKDYHFARS